MLTRCLPGLFLKKYLLEYEKGKQKRKNEVKFSNLCLLQVLLGALAILSYLLFIMLTITAVLKRKFSEVNASASIYVIIILK